MLILLPWRIRRNSIPDLLAQIDPGVLPAAPDQKKLQKTVGFIDSLLRYRVFRRYGKCLLRSLILFRFLRLQGWPVEIHFGVRKKEDALTNITGHSWLTINDKAFLEEEEHPGRFATTYSYPVRPTAA